MGASEAPGGAGRGKSAKTGLVGKRLRLDLYWEGEDEGSLGQGQGSGAQMPSVKAWRAAWGLGASGVTPSLSSVMPAGREVGLMWPHHVIFREAEKLRFTCEVICFVNLSKKIKHFREVGCKKHMKVI